MSFFSSFHAMGQQRQGYHAIYLDAYDWNNLAIARRIIAGMNAGMMHDSKPSSSMQGVMLLVWSQLDPRGHELRKILPMQQTDYRKYS